MRVLLDDRELTVERPTVAAALDAGRRAAETAGRVIIEANLDGAAIRDDDLERPPQDPRPGSEVRFVTADPKSLVRVSLLDVADALAKAKRDQTAAAELIQSGKLEESLPHLSAALTVWDTVRQVVQTGAALLGARLDEVTVHVGGVGVTMGDAVSRLAERLTELKRTLTAQDWSGLCDALAYDLQDEADRWAAILRTLADTIAR